MKAKMVILLATGIIFTFVIYGMAFAEGGEPPPVPPCTNLPPPNSGPYLKGYLIVTYDKYAARTELQPEHYNVAAILEEDKGVFGCSNSKAKHIFSISLPVGNRDLCSLNDNYFIQTYGHMPCNLDVGKPFGLQGIPVITELKITNKDNCGDIEKAKILGTVRIRIVPPKQK